jgi:hypothetical protein
MATVSLNMYEIIEILDPLNQNAYDKLQSKLEEKLCKLISEDKWLEIWDSGNWSIDMTLNIEEEVKS